MEKTIKVVVTIKYSTEDDTHICENAMVENLGDAIEHERKEGMLTTDAISADWVTVGSPSVVHNTKEDSAGVGMRKLFITDVGKQWMVVFSIDILGYLRIHSITDCVSGICIHVKAGTATYSYVHEVVSDHIKELSLDKELS